MQKCKDVMRNPVSCLLDDAAADIAPLMRRNNVGSIPVVENEQTQKLVGIVTVQEVVLRVLSDWREARFSKVEAITTRDVVACHPDDDLQKALNVMSEHQLDLVPIVDSDNKILGIIAQEDLMMHLDQPE